MTRPYLSGIINYYKTQKEWKIHLTIAINFFSSKDLMKLELCFSMMGSETD